MLTQGELKGLIHYDPETGIFTKGYKPVGRLDKHGHLRITINGKWHYAYRLAWLYMTGSFPIHKVINRHENLADISWENLIEVTRKCRKGNCKFKKYNAENQAGVYWSEKRQKWKAYIIVHSLNKNLGYHSSYINAKLARDQAEEEYGFPDCTEFSQFKLLTEGRCKK